MENNELSMIDDEIGYNITSEFNLNLNFIENTFKKSMSESLGFIYIFSFKIKKNTDFLKTYIEIDEIDEVLDHYK